MVTDNEMKILIKSQQGEIDAVLMYQALARVVKDRRDAEAFLKLAADEGRHGAVFKEITGKALRPKKTRAILLPLLYRILGRKRLYPLIAKGEYAALDVYGPFVERFPTVQSVKDDEKRHGDTVLGLLQPAGR